MCRLTGILGEAVFLSPPTPPLAHRGLNCYIDSQSSTVPDVKTQSSPGARRHANFQRPKAQAMATVAAPTKQIPISEIPPGKLLCEYCTGKCCRYFALPIDTPENYEDFEYIRWYLLHDLASIFTEDEDWYLLVHTQCEHLQPDNRCGIYDTRPQICRDYSTDDCEYEDQWTYERYLETADQVAEYTEAVIQKRGRSIRSRKPPLLPVVG